MKQHAKALCRTIRENFNVEGAEHDRPLLGVEIGVWRGELSRALLSTFPSLRLVLVDPWELLKENHSWKTPRELRIAKNETLTNTRAFSNRVTIFEETSAAAAKRFGEGKFDFVFIDANHHYESVKEDLELWVPKIREGGFASGHDYNGRMEKRGKWGVKRAVDEYAEAHGYQVHTRTALVWWFNKSQVEAEETETEECASE